MQPRMMIGNRLGLHTFFRKGEGSHAQKRMTSIRKYIFYLYKKYRYNGIRGRYSCRLLEKLLGRLSENQGDRRRGRRMGRRQKTGECAETEMGREPGLLSIYLIMFRIGCITYGGGWSILAQMEEEFSRKRNWVTREELLDFMSLARSFPGIMVINLSVLFGYRVRGAAGSAAAAFGLASPAFFVITAITFCYSAVITNPWIARIMIGVRCAVVPIILTSAMHMKKKALKGPVTWWLAGIAFLLCIFTGINKLLMVIAAAVTGLFLWGKKQDDTP